jgi:ribosomal protein L36
MKTTSSLRKLKVRQDNLQVVRRGKRVYLVIKKKKGQKDFDKRFKSKQGY